MNLDLGGPGAGCSAMRVRRLAAGELSGAEKERALEHVAGCARCAATQRELALEQEQLRRDVPFPQFAAGVAEKLAWKPRRSFVARWAPLLAAAGVALAAGIFTLRPADTATVRSKGGPGAQIFVQDARGARELTDEPVAPGARLMITLRPSGLKYAAAVLIEAEGLSVIYSGAAVNGPLPQAFEWTGKGDAGLLIVLSDRPIDAARLRDPKDAPHDGFVLEQWLHR